MRLAAENAEECRRRSSAFAEASTDGCSLVRLRAKRYGETSTKLQERSRGGGRIDRPARSRNGLKAVPYRYV